MRLVVIASLMLFSTTALAAPAGSDTDADAAARRSADGKAKAKVDARYEFENDDVTGDSISPDHEGVRTKLTTRHASMIQLRMHFIPQLLQMAQDL